MHIHRIWVDCLSFRNENSLKANQREPPHQHTHPTRNSFVFGCLVITKMWPDRRAFTGASRCLGCENKSQFLMKFVNLKPDSSEWRDLVKTPAIHVLRNGVVGNWSGHVLFISHNFLRFEESKHISDRFSGTE